MAAGLGTLPQEPRRDGCLVKNLDMVQIDETKRTIALRFQHPFIQEHILYYTGERDPA